MDGWYDVFFLSWRSGVFARGFAKTGVEVVVFWW
jgi:hypothetical protein